jgi:type IV secretory pathway VirB6-like protein
VDKLFILPKGQFAPISDFSVQAFVTAVINLVLIVAVILFMIAIFSSGFKFMLSAGDKERMKAAGRQLLNAFIGIVLVFSTWALMGVAGQFLGVNLLEFSIPTI